MSDNTYNGWSNYQTWNCASWFDNDEGTQDTMNEWAMECVQEAIVDTETEAIPEWADKP